MSNIITFIKAPKITSFYPAVGFPGTNFSVTGDDLEDVEHLYFMDVFDNKVEAVFQTGTQSGQTILVGNVPLLDGTVGPYQIRAENVVGESTHCCFNSLTTTQTTIANISGDDVKQIDDKYAINSEINNTPTNTQGFEVINLSYSPVSPSTKLVIQCELSLQSSFWGSAVMALFKNNETTPKKVWNFALMGLNFGQVAKLGYIADSGSLSNQTWRVRLGRTQNSYPVIYVNRNIDTPVPYGGATNSWIGITEIDG